jgi:copper(I)-binding protein
LKRTILLAAASLVCTHALADITVGDPWIRATVPAQKSAGAFMSVRSTAATRLVEVATPVAGRAEIHQMSMEGQTMRMHAVDGIDLKPNQPVGMASGGYHIMLLDLKRQLKEGEQVPVSLRFVGPDGKPENVTVTVPVKPIAYQPTAAAAH